MLGAVYNGGTEAETPEEVAERLLAAAKYIPPERLQVAPDCGLVTIPAELARRKLQAMVEGCNLARKMWLEQRGSQYARGQ